MSGRVHAEAHAAPKSNFVPVRTGLLAGSSGKQLVSQPPLVQAKLTINQPNDRYELEADRVADEVVSRINAPHRKAVQHQQLFEESEEHIQMKPLAQQIHSFSEQNFTAGGETGITPNLEMSIRQAQGDGNFLPEQVREPIEQVFGTDFSKVRIHTDAVSHRQNQALKANAFTTGQDIFFREGAYNPGNNQGRELLAHELTHVMQQKKSKSSTKIIQLSPITDFQTALLLHGYEENIHEQLTIAINSIQLADLEEAEELFEILNNPCSEESLADDFDTFLDPEYRENVLSYLWRRILRLRDDIQAVPSEDRACPVPLIECEVKGREGGRNPATARDVETHERPEPVVESEVTAERNAVQIVALASMDQFRDRIFNKLDDCLQIALRVGSAYENAYTNFRRVLENRADVMEANSEVFFGLLTAVTAGSLAFLSSSLQGIAGSRQILFNSIEDTLQSVISEGFDVVQTSIAPVMQTVGSNPQNFQNDIVSYVIQLRKNTRTYFMQIRYKFIEAPRRSWDSFNLAEQNRSYESWFESQPLAQVPGLDEIPDQISIQNSLEREFWALWLPSLRTTRVESLGRDAFGSLPSGAEVENILPLTNPVEEELTRLGITQESGINDFGRWTSDSEKLMLLNWAHQHQPTRIIDILE